MNTIDYAEPAATATEKPPGLYRTSCKECCFATFEGDTQVGCRFGRVEKFRESGVAVKEAYDADREFFVIETACLLHRDRSSPWARTTPGRDRAAAARREIALAVDVVVVLDGEDTVAGLAESLEGVAAQSLPPARVRAVVNKEGVRSSEVRPLLRGDWVCQFIVERDAAGARVSEHRCVDHAVHGSTSDFYVAVRAGTVLPPGFLADIDAAINDGLCRFVLLEPTAELPAGVVQVRAHHYYGGNAEAVVVGEDAGAEGGTRADTIGDKIRHRARVEGLPHLVKKVTDVCRTRS